MSALPRTRPRTPRPLSERLRRLYPAPVLCRAVDFTASTSQFPWEDLVDAEFAFDDFMAAIGAAQEKKVTRVALLVGEGDGDRE